MKKIILITIARHIDLQSSMKTFHLFRREMNLKYLIDEFYIFFSWYCNDILLIFEKLNFYFVINEVGEQFFPNLVLKLNSINIYLYVSGMVAMGCGIDEYIVLNPAFSGILGVAGVAAGGAEFAVLPLPAPPLAPPVFPAPPPPPTTWSTEVVRLWFLSFSSRRHFARRLLNQTWEKTEKT